MTSRISSEILAYYEHAAERERLVSGVFQLEFLRTKEVMDRWLPPPAIVLDVGGGPGRYSAWLDRCRLLAERGVPFWWQGLSSVRARQKPARSCECE